MIASRVTAVKHIVMWRLLGNDVGERAEAGARVKSAFENLRGHIPGLITIEVGIDAAAGEDACHAVLVSEFESQTALEAYVTHPEHARVQDELAGLRTSRLSIDYLVDR